jgi:hypothetical protein
MGSPVGEQGGASNDQFAQVHENAEELLRIHKDMEAGEINITDAVSRYELKYGRDGVLRLLEDLQKMQFLYKNLLEEIKRMDPKLFDPFQPTPDRDNISAAISNKYISVGLLPEQYLPHTTPVDLAKAALTYLPKLRHSLWNIVKTYPRELFYALRLDPGTTITFQITTGIDLGVAVGWERTIDGHPAAQRVR